MPTIAAADLQVFYREWNADAAADAGPPVVLIHGNWSTHRWWIPLAPWLGGRRLLAPDLRGRGQTETRDDPGRGYSLAELAADLLAFLDALGLAEVHVVAHSLGTGVAMELGLVAPARLASLVLIAPVWVDGMPAKWDVWDRHAAAHADIAVFEAMLRPMAPSFDDPELWAELVETGHRQRPRATRASLRALVDWRPGDALGRLTMPRVVIDGEHDPLCGGETARRAAEALGCERVCLAGIGHSPNLEAPERVAAIAARLFEAV